MQQHMGGVKEIAQDLECDVGDGDDKPTGLKPVAAESNREKYGRNELPPKEYDGLLEIFVNSFKDPTLILLIVVAFVQIIIFVVTKTVDFQGCTTADQQACKANLIDVQNSFVGNYSHAKTAVTLDGCHDFYFSSTTLLPTEPWKLGVVSALKTDHELGFRLSGSKLYDLIRQCKTDPPKLETCVNAHILRVTSERAIQPEMWRRALLHYQYIGRSGTQCRITSRPDDCTLDGLCPLTSDSAHEEEVPLDAIAILVTVLLVSSVATIQDYNSQRSFRLLEDQMEDSKVVHVVRGGSEQQIHPRDVVVGDLVQIRTGDKLCADGYCVSSANMQITEADMTGEPDPIAKLSFNEAHKWEDAWMFCGTEVQIGTGTMLVTCVGEQTQFGQMMAKVTENADADEDTPLQQKLAVMANRIGQAGTAAAVFTFIGLLLLFFVGEIGIGGKSCDVAAVSSEIVSYLIIAVTVVVVAVPEGLPLAVTIALSASMGKMKKESVLVKKLKACETMGGATNICTDKTGTLTENKMTLVAGWFAGCSVRSGSGGMENVASAIWHEFGEHSAIVKQLIEGCACNTEDTSHTDFDASTGVHKFTGNPTECAMLRLVEELGGNYTKQRQLFVPSSSRHTPFLLAWKMMTTIIGQSCTVTAHGTVRAPCTCYCQST